MARSTRTANRRRAARRRRTRYHKALDKARAGAQQFRTLFLVAVVGTLFLMSWYDQIAGAARHVLGVANAGAPLEAGIAGPAPPPVSTLFDDVSGKGKGFVDSAAGAVAAVSAALLGLAKAVDALTKAFGNGET